MPSFEEDILARRNGRGRQVKKPPPAVLRVQELSGCLQRKEREKEREKLRKNGTCRDRVCERERESERRKRK